MLDTVIFYFFKKIMLLSRKEFSEIVLQNKGQSNDKEKDHRK